METQFTFCEVGTVFLYTFRQILDFKNVISKNNFYLKLLD